MAKRPAFYVSEKSDGVKRLVDVVMVDFDWVAGMAITQKQKCIDSLHSAIQNQRPASILEISSKSREVLGVKLSAFNLGFTNPKTNQFISVESAFQGSKVFDSAGPFTELYSQNARDAKIYFRDKKYGPLVRFDFYGQIWPLNPRTLFYDWLYLNSLHRTPHVADLALKYDCFTDIEFNPKKSINCQAYSAALFVSLSRRGRLKDLLENRETYMNFMKDSQGWIQSTEFMKHHSLDGERLFDTP